MLNSYVGHILQAVSFKAMITVRDIDNLHWLSFVLEKPQNFLPLRQTVLIAQLQKLAAEAF